MTRIGTRHLRAVRFEPNMVIKILVRRVGTRSYSFFAQVVNISTTGMLIESSALAIIPFQVNTMISMTVDLASSIFERPITLEGEVIRLVDHNGVQAFGIRTTKIEVVHEQIFARGMQLLQETGDIANKQ